MFQIKRSQNIKRKISYERNNVRQRVQRNVRYLIFLYEDETTNGLTGWYSKLPFLPTQFLKETPLIVFLLYISGFARLRPIFSRYSVKKYLQNISLNLPKETLSTMTKSKSKSILWFIRLADKQTDRNTNAESYFVLY